MRLAGYSDGITESSGDAVGVVMVHTSRDEATVQHGLARFPLGPALMGQ